MASLQGTTITVPERALMNRLTLTITMYVQRDWRCRLGLWIAKLGLLLTGMQVQFLGDIGEHRNQNSTPAQ